ncbi:hypothetical protein B0H11DRAFT_2228951 [Mycena galericulata]|nr:hypothetical protein B0H11DRAFT_2228951 [Mycena galericulata]
MHNAAGGMGPFTLTEDNVEVQFATAHVGPFLLTTLLAAKLVPRNTLRKSCSSRARRTPRYPLDFGSRSTPRTALRSRRASSPPSSSPVGITTYSLQPGAIFTNVHRREGEGDFSWKLYRRHHFPTPRGSSGRRSGPALQPPFDPRLNDNEATTKITPHYPEVPMQSLTQGENYLGKITPKKVHQWLIVVREPFPEPDWPLLNLGAGRPFQSV